MAMTMTRAFLALLFACTTAAAQHQHGHAGAMPGGRDELGASAIFDALGTLWAVFKDGDHVMLRRSQDAGRSWSPAIPVNKTPEPIEAGGDARPKLAAGTKGELYVTWTRPLEKPYTGFIRFARSTDGGKTFSTPITVHGDRQDITHRFDSIIVTPEGRIFTAWVDKRDGEVARKQHENYSGAALYFAVSDDGGKTFRGDHKIADHSCECCRIALLPNDDGSVTVFWRHVFPVNIRDHALARIYPDGRVDGFRRATFDNWVVEACPHHGGSLARDAQGNLHAVWFDLGLQHPGAVYGVLRAGEISGLTKIGAETAEHPDLAIVGKRIVIVWKEFDGEKSQLWARLSDDEGATWRQMTVASTENASDQPHLVNDRGELYVFWNTRETPLAMYRL